MAQITEDYVSFETAKLLKKKGFNNPCLMYYDGYPDEPEYTTLNNFYNMEEAIHYIDDPRPYITLAPTFQLTMKWLREVYNIHIATEPYCGYDTYSIFIWKDCQSIDWMDSFHTFKTHEEGVESAIKYCLEELVE